MLYYIAKTKDLIICTFVFAFANIKFSHNEAFIDYLFMLKSFILLCSLMLIATSSQLHYINIQMYI